MAIYRRSPQSGIAIGPILFIIAILGILVAALAAGDGGFNSSSANEANKTRAGTVIQEGVTMKMGIENILVYGTTDSTIIVSPSYSASNELISLYAPKGGAILPQTAPHQAIASGAAWKIAKGANMEGVGFAGGNDDVAYINISNEVMCKAINEDLFGKSAPLVLTLPVITTPVVGNDVTALDGVIDATNVFDTSGTTAVTGLLQSCVADGSTPTKYWYYQVLKAN